MADRDDGAQLTFRLPAPEDVPAPEAANVFFFTYVGPEIQLLVGYVDLRQIHEAKQDPKKRVLTPRITHRFALSQLGFEHLKAQLTDIDNKIKRTGKTTNG